MITQESVEILPQVKEILNELNSLKNSKDWGDIWYETATARDRALTRSLCNDDDADFILERNGYAFQFTFSNQWEVRFLNRPVYWVDPELFTGLNFDSFVTELQYELEGLDIKIGSDCNNKDSMIVNIFHDRIKQAINTAIKNSNG